MTAITSPLDSLKAARSARRDELSKIEEARVRLTSAENEEAAILAQIGALGAAEIEAVREWAKAGGTGDMPQPDAKKRAALNAALIAAQAKAAAAKGAVADLDAEQGRVAGELETVESSIATEALQILKNEHAAALASLRALSLEVQAQSSHVAAFRQFLSVEGLRHQAAGRRDEAMSHFRLGEEIAGQPPIEFAPSPGEITQSVATWAGRHEALKA